MDSISLTELDLLWSEYPYMPVIDVLSPEDFTEWHIPSSFSVCVAEGDFVEQVEVLSGGKNLPVVLYCEGTVGTASVQGAALLEREGFTDVHVLQGGMEEWVRSGRMAESAYAIKEES